jgi:hypothetical protein
MSELFHNEDIGPSFSKYILENGHLYDMTETKMAPFSKWNSEGSFSFAIIIHWDEMPDCCGDMHSANGSYTLS